MRPATARDVWSALGIIVTPELGVSWLSAAAVHYTQSRGICCWLFEAKHFLPTLLKYLQLQYFSPLTACCWCRNSSWIVFSNFHLICVLWNWREDESFLVSSEKCFQYLNIQKKISAREWSLVMDDGSFAYVVCWVS